MPDERDKPFRAARREALAQRAKIQRATAGEIVQLLRVARDRIRAALAAQPSDFQRWRLGILNREVDRALAELEQGGAAAIERGAAAAWEAGHALVDAPLAAAGETALVAELGPRVDTRQLFQMRNFMVDRIKDISAESATRIEQELGLVIVGVQSPSEAIERLTEIFQGNRRRALMIVRTELGRVFSAAAQERMEQAKEKLPGLKKQWRRSGKLHPRPQHDAIDGQVREVDEPFTLGNGVEILFPRAPDAPPGETINCGCESLPFVDRWPVRHPGRKPLTPEERAAREEGRSLSEILR